LFCRAETIAALVGKSAHTVVDGWYPAQALFPAYQERLTEPGRNPLSLADDLFTTVMSSHLPAGDRAEESALRGAMLAWLSDPTLPLVQMASNLGISLRSLQRLFKTNWGVTPKLVQRMLRLQWCMACWAKQTQDLAALAAEAGLSDQAHLAREFRELVGYPPRLLKATDPDAGEADMLWALAEGRSRLLPLLLSSFSKTGSSRLATMRSRH
jgi:AraC-like DNA-binding protein